MCYFADCQLEALKLLLSFLSSISLEPFRVIKVKLIEIEM